MIKSFSFRILSFVLLPVITVGCTRMPVDNGVSAVGDIVSKNMSRVGQEFPDLPPDTAEVELSMTEISQKISAPLSLYDAERLSVLVNPVVRKQLAMVGAAEADYAQAGRIENPGFTLERFTHKDFAASLLFDIGGVLLLPLKRKLAMRQLEVARYEAAINLIAHIGETQRAWVNAVAESQQLQLLQRALESAEAGNQLTRQMSALGHSSIVDAAKSDILLSSMRAAVSEQKVIASGAREQLIRQLGLWGEQARELTLPASLPEVPTAPQEIAAVERQAIENRLDVRMAILNVEAMAKNFNLTRLNPFLAAFEFGPVVESVHSERERGYELEFRLPIFDPGGIKNRKARAIFDQAVAQAEITGVKAASEARQATTAYWSSWEIANNYRVEVVPKRQRISRERMLRYNGMLISVFDLLEDVRTATAVESEYVDSVRQYWLQNVNLQQALMGAGTSSLNFVGSRTMPGPASGGEEH